MRDVPKFDWGSTVGWALGLLVRVEGWRWGREGRQPDGLSRGWEGGCREFYDA